MKIRKCAVIFVIIFLIGCEYHMIKNQSKLTVVETISKYYSDEKFPELEKLVYTNTIDHQVVAFYESNSSDRISCVVLGKRLFGGYTPRKYAGSQQIKTPKESNSQYILNKIPMANTVDKDKSKYIVWGILNNKKINEVLYKGENVFYVVHFDDYTLYYSVFEIESEDEFNSKDLEYVAESGVSI